MKAIEAIFNAILIGIVVGLIALGTIFVVKGGEVKTFEKPVMSNIVLPLYAMADGKQHNMYQFNNVIIDISYNK